MRLKVILGAPSWSWSLVKGLVAVSDGLFPLPPLFCHQKVWELSLLHLGLGPTDLSRSSLYLYTNWFKKCKPANSKCEISQAQILILGKTRHEVTLQLSSSQVMWICTFDVSQLHYHLSFDDIHPLPSAVFPKSIISISRL